MFSFIGTFFSSTKNIIIAIGAALIGGYVLKLKYDSYQAKDRLKAVENKIAKANVVIATKKAKAKASAVKIETSTEVEVLRELKKESKKVQKEMQDIEKDIHKAKASKKVVNRTRSKKINIEV